MNFLRGLWIPGVILCGWIVAAKRGIVSPFIVPPPDQVLVTAHSLLTGGVLAKHLTASLYRVVAGFTVTFLAAFPLAVLFGMQPALKPYVNPLLEFLRHIPPIACIPILILWLGIGEASKLAVIILAAFFPIFLNTLDGIRNCDAKLLEVGEVFGFSAWEKFRRIILPASLPSVIVGVRLGLGYSWRALIGAELIAASSGIGYMILDAEQISRSDVVIIGIITIGLFGCIMDYAFLALARWGLPWCRRKAEYDSFIN